MKIIFRLLSFSFFFIIFLSCSQDDVKNPIHGDWELIIWSVDIPFELDDNMTSSLNILDKTACEVNEILSFNNKGVVTSNDTFSSEIIISLKDGTSDEYEYTETCAEGSIGFAMPFTQVDNQNVNLNGAVGTVTSQRLTLVYPNAIKIYNQALTEVISTKDLTLVYEKK